MINYKLNIKFIIFYTLLLLSIDISFAQSHWETIIQSASEWKYLPATGEPSVNWKDLSFNDANWATGVGGIGYGDGDDATVIGPVKSLYLRQKFTVEDISSIERLLLDIDYDDAFVAYLNGYKVAWSYNLIELVNSFDTKPLNTREALMYSGGIPERYYLNPLHLIEGENILAVHIINDEVNSSDLSSIIFLNARINSDAILYSETPTWFEEPNAFGEANIPIVSINTNKQLIPDEPRIIAHMGIVDHGPGQMNKLTDPFNVYNGRISLEIRGQSTQLFPKKSYAFETQDILGENNNVSLLGMPAENDWVLHAPYSDKPLLRNFITFKLGSMTSQYCSRTALCELYIDSIYQGVYLLMEKIKRDANRVKIERLESFENQGDELTGGYILRVDKKGSGYINNYDGWRSDHSYPGRARFDLQYFYPKPDKITGSQRQYIQKFISDFEYALGNFDFNDPNSGYNKYIDVGSFVDFMLVNEISKEVDTYKFSTYFHKENYKNGGKLHAGPIWDFNFGYANADYWSGSYTHEDWLYKNNGGVIYWWERLMEDSYYENLTYTRWTELRQGHFSDANIGHILDSISTYIDGAQTRNYERWPILDKYIKPNNYVGGSYLNEVNYLKNWIYDRLDWMDENLNGSLLFPTVQVTTIPNWPAEDKEIRLKVEVDEEYFNREIIKSKNVFLEGENISLVVDTVLFVSASEINVVLTSPLGNIDYDQLNNLRLTLDSKILNGFHDLTSPSFQIINTENIKYLSLDLFYTYQSGMLSMQCDRPEKLPAYISIYGINGQSIGNFDIQNLKVNAIPVDLSSNVYVVHCLIEGQNVTRKLVVMD